MEALSVKKRNQIAAMFGLILGVYLMIKGTISYALIGDMVKQGIVSVLFYAVYIVLVVLFVKNIKAKKGGYITFKDAFGAMIVMFLIANLLYFLYNYVYTQYIDPNVAVKLKEASLKFAQKSGVSDDQLDKMAAEFDKNIADSKHFNLLNNLKSYFFMVLVDLLPALIIAAIMKKEKPMSEVFAEQ